MSADAKNVATTSKATAKPSSKSGEEIVQGFQRLRNEQRQLVSKLSELEQDSNEHKLVIETLQDVDGNRKCFRLVGGVLVERTVNQVLPALIINRDQLTATIESLKQQLSTKGQELNDYMEKNNIRVRGKDEAPGAEKAPKAGTSSNVGVLVDSKS
uniref:EOG090X0L97 n=1 Tax=Lynceus sp. MCZ IZ 141354 TaxID=1930659 RepID=A0A9N6WTE0_9CRUS|nr:EOG090X0L97 [Lynceus sp. MCZ IZ 141354]